MKKNDFLSLVLGVVGVLVFGIGLCMCLLPEWNMFRPGVIVTAVGAVVLVLLALLRWIAAGKPTAHVDWKKTGKIIYGTAAALVLGVGMCMIMVWNMMIPGMIVGAAGILLLLGLIPMIKGLK